MFLMLLMDIMIVREIADEFHGFNNFSTILMMIFIELVIVRQHLVYFYQFVYP